MLNKKLSKRETIMEEMISKSQFKPHALQYFREVEQTGKELIISDRGKPVLKIVPYTENPEEALKSLRNTVVKYEDPTEPVGLEDWEALK
jgi:prevent-host-death family protein